MRFHYDDKRLWKSSAQRSAAMGLNGMVATSQGLASLAGQRILAKGGNAVDAAVAMAAVLNVVEPHSVGIGGDAFALIYLADHKKVLGMNASGRAPKEATPIAFKERGLTKMPDRGVYSITVPGALAGWYEAQNLYGKLRFDEVLEPAIVYAQDGFPVTEVIAGEWKTQEDVLIKNKGAAETFLINGKAPKPGEVFRNSALAAAFIKIAEQGPDVLYGGELGEIIVKEIRNLGGLMSLADLTNHKVDWVDPISVDYRGYQVLELPPNGQGVTALEILNILSGYDVGSMKPFTAEFLHVLIEAIKIAFADRNYYIADPYFKNIPVTELLSMEYRDACIKAINPDKASFYPSPHYKHSDTIYAAAVDKYGNAASFISSIFIPFGSGIVAGGTGIALHSRGSSFSLDPDHPNCVEPCKRPMHTIIPGMLCKDNKFLCAFGVMGGDMQPQGHAQFLTNVIDFGMNLQEAVDAPRIRVMNGKDVYFENGVPEQVVKVLAEKGHGIHGEEEPVNMVGGGQAVYRSPDGPPHVLIGGSDRRKDGAAIGY